MRESDFFRESQIENEVQRDKKYREEVLKEYVENIPLLTILSFFKKRDDFTDEDLYNNYLEEIEDISKNLYFSTIKI